MSTPSENTDPDNGPYKDRIDYFDQQVLAAYRNEPDKYRIEGDLAWGRLQLTEKYFLELDAQRRRDEFIDVEFSCRTLTSGKLAIAVFLPDLLEKSRGHVQRWGGFRLPNPQWSSAPDERFTRWVRRTLGGEWPKVPGVHSRLAKAIHTINCMTDEAVGKALFKHELRESLCFPTAENSHRYQDAHIELYGYLIDGLDRDCISLVAARVERPIEKREKRTVMDLKKVFVNLEMPSKFAVAYDLVSDQRGLAAHKVRLPAETMAAFDQFTKDLELCVAGLHELLSTLESELGIDSRKATARSEARKTLPKIGRPSELHYSICQATQMAGKTIERVEFGYGEEVEDAHRDEVLIIHFTDGSILGIDTGSNVGNLADEVPGLKAEAFDVSFRLRWVPGR
ncbi:MAG: hypothetical protein HZA90_13415 [Verrucomicrobia bacterium]|nr:hypothetical protein [Verrucomicrobiota bacterium]